MGILIEVEDEMVIEEEKMSIEIEVASIPHQGIMVLIQAIRG